MDDDNGQQQQEDEELEQLEAAEMLQWFENFGERNHGNPQSERPRKKAPGPESEPCTF